MEPEISEHFFELSRSGTEDPDHQLLYHYTDVDSALNKILVNQTLRFSPSLSMSDPMESSPPPVIVTDQAGKRLSGDLIEDASETLNAMRAQMSQLSLTMDASGYQPPFGRGYARARMWDRYGEAHTGVCLSFDAAEMVGPFLESTRRFGAVNCRWVDYNDEVTTPGSRVLAVDGLSKANLAEVLTKYVMENEAELFFTKLLEWDSEFEYRLLMFRPTSPPRSAVYVPFGNALRTIILGERFDPGLIAKARQMATSLNVPLVRLDWSQGRPSVEELS